MVATPNHINKILPKMIFKAYCLIIREFAWSNYYYYLFFFFFFYPKTIWFTILFKNEKIRQHESRIQCGLSRITNPAELNGFLFSLGFDFRNIFVKVYQIATVECHSINQGKCLPWMLIRCGS